MGHAYICVVQWKIMNIKCYNSNNNSSRQKSNFVSEIKRQSYIKIYSVWGFFYNIPQRSLVVISSNVGLLKEHAQYICLWTGQRPARSSTCVSRCENTRTVSNCLQITCHVLRHTNIQIEFSKWCISSRPSYANWGRCHPIFSSEKKPPKLQSHGTMICAIQWKNMLNH